MNSLMRILQFVLPYKRRLIRAVILTGALTLVSMVPPLLLRYLADDIVTAGRWDMLGRVIAAMIAVPVLMAAIRLANRTTIAYVARRLVFDFRLAMYRRLQGLSLRFYDNTPAGKIIERIMWDVNAIQQLVTGQTITFVCDVVSCVVALTLAFYLSWQLSLLLVVILPLYLVNYRHFVRKLVKNREDVRDKMDEISAVLQERLAAPATIKSFAREKHETRAFVGELRENYDISRMGVGYGSAFSTASDLIRGIGSAVLYCAACYLVIEGRMSYGSVIAFMAYVMCLLDPAVRFSEMFNNLQQTKISVDRIIDLLDEQPDVEERPDAVTLENVQGEVVFDDVGFHYKEGEPVLDGVAATMKPGTINALVGHTGSGKTTMATLLYRFYDICSGAIRIDGTDIRDVKLRSLRQHMGIVLQDTVLFNCSVADNIRYARQESSMEEVAAAAKVAEIHDFIETLAEGYETIIGEGGTKLSVGERQRIAIARAIITDPAILVLDEATSSLDTESERAIQRALSSVMRNRTSLVIAHRLSTIVSADQIIVLDKGRIVEVGRHHDLLARPGGFYRDLCRRQFSEASFIEEEDEGTREGVLQAV